MPTAQAYPAAASSVDSLLIACPADNSLNRVPSTRLSESPKCGRCSKPLFQGRTVTLTSSNFDHHALKSDLPLVIDFWAAWCAPCRTMSPNFEAAASRLEPRVRLAKLDTQAEQQIAARYKIQGIPSLILLKHGRETARTAGAMPTNAIVQWVEHALSSA